jgi:hypothetical protein
MIRTVQTAYGSPCLASNGSPIEILHLAHKKGDRRVWTYFPGAVPPGWVRIEDDGISYSGCQRLRDERFLMIMPERQLNPTESAKRLFSRQIPYCGVMGEKFERCHCLSIFHGFKATAVYDYVCVKDEDPDEPETFQDSESKGSHDHQTEGIGEHLCEPFSEQDLEFDQKSAITVDNEDDESIQDYEERCSYDCGESDCDGVNWCPRCDRSD